PDNTEFAGEFAWEFAREWGDKLSQKASRLQEAIKNYTSEHLKGVKVTAVKLMIGSMMITSATLGGILLAASQSVSAASADVSSGASAGAGTIAGTGTVSGVTAGMYTVQPGDTLWGISNRFHISVTTLKKINSLTDDTLYPGQQLRVAEPVQRVQYTWHRVAAGESLWIIANQYGTTVPAIRQLNNLSGDIIYTGQALKVKAVTLTGLLHTVKAGETLWLIARNYNTTVDEIRGTNGISGDILSIGQQLFIPFSDAGGKPAPVPVPSPAPSPAPVLTWPAVTHIVRYGDTVTSVAALYGTSAARILTYNYMKPDEWLSAGDRIAISGYAPRSYTVTPGESTAPARTGKIVDWVTEGQYLLKRGDVFTLVDTLTGKPFRMVMMGGYNHSDVEPLTRADTDAMRSLFGSWQWNPRAVVVFKDGMNIAASLSGMPHSVEMITDNGVLGHFDLYLSGSTSHSTTTSADYIRQHQAMVLRAAGR
ncbi:MAG TPA: hypothetical protein DD727_02735, partial [Clostridiales bacterium]|nr:hypothetical protein [Clostridiales bacterium]